MELSNDLVILDLETTGTWVERDNIIEIAMIKCSPDGSRATYDKQVNPGIPIPPVVSELTGITNEDVGDAPVFRDLAGEIISFIGDSDFAGFNIERFDLPLLRREIYDAGLKVNWEGAKIFDVQKVFHLNEKRDLTAAYQFYCDKDLSNAHSALADTQATLEILEKQVSKYGEDTNALDSLRRFEYKKTSEFVDNERKFRWWNGKAYMMFGKYARKYSLQEVARMDRGYLEWIVSAKFSEEVKTLVSNALQGHFPVFELENNIKK